MGKRRGNHEGSIFPRGSDGLWVATISYRDSAGKSHRPRRYRKTYKAALEALRELQREAENGVQLATKSPTVAVYLEQWLTASVAPSVRPKTYQGYRSIVEVRITPRIGGLKLNRLTPLAIQGLYADLAAAGLSSRSIIHTHRCLRKALQQAMKWGFIARNPCDAVDAPRAPRTEMHVLDRDQVNQFLSSTAGHRDHALYTLAVTTGLRQGELLGLMWTDIDLDGGRLSVQRSLQAQRGRGLVFTEPKTSKSRRTVMLSKWAVSALREHRKRQVEERLLAGSEWSGLDLVFADPVGKPLSGSGTTKRFQKALAAAGLPIIRFHDLRHTAATLLLLRGVHVKLVSEMLGHSSISLTLDTYSHVIPAMHAEAAHAMDALLGS